MFISTLFEGHFLSFASLFAFQRQLCQISLSFFVESLEIKSNKFRVYFAVCCIIFSYEHRIFSVKVLIVLSIIIRETDCMIRYF